MQKITIERTRYADFNKRHAELFGEVYSALDKLKQSAMQIEYIGVHVKDDGEHNWYYEVKMSFRDPPPHKERGEETFTLDKYWERGSLERSIISHFSMHINGRIRKIEELLRSLEACRVNQAS